MAAVKQKTIYVCSECGYESPKWYGKCPDCGEWNTLIEEVRAPEPASAKRAPVTAAQMQAVRLSSIREVDTSEEERYHTGLSELDRVLGGGLVKGSLVLLGGDPGIGKSTMLLQICEYLGKQHTILYISGEESVRQIKLRADRLGVNCANLYVVSETNVDVITTTIEQYHPDIVMIDSIQTMNLHQLSSSPGSVSQVRECTSRLLSVAKSLDIPTILVGHVNKDGAIAGPKVLEHIVDAVLHFEGDRQMAYRILRAVKNRYGSTNEIGVFEMQDTGLQEVENPSMMLLEGRPTHVSGTCVACVMEGTRPILAEVQALVTKTNFAAPRRVATGFDFNRMALLVAVLEKRLGYYFGSSDVYINVIGGLRIDEPAADLSVALSLVSGLKDKAIDDGVIAFGELGLAGEIRSVSSAELRIAEAAKLGFTRCIVPKQSLKNIRNLERYPIEVVPVRSIYEAVAAISKE